MQDKIDNDGLGPAVSEQDLAAAQRDEPPVSRPADNDGIVNLDEWRATHRKVGWPE